MADLITIGINGTVCMWQHDKCVHEYTLNENNSVHHLVSISPNGNYAATSHKSLVRLWNIKDSTFISIPIPFQRLIFSIGVSNEYVAIGSDNGIYLHLFDGTLKSTFKEDNVYDVKFSPDGKFLLSGNGNKTANIWDIATRKIHITLNQVNIVFGVAWSPKNDTIAIACEEMIGYIWNVNGTLAQKLNGRASLFI